MTQRQWYYLNELCTVPPNTAVATPVIIPIPTGDIWLENVRYYIPPGPSLLMGWYLAMGGVPILPWTGNNAWIIENDSKDVLDVMDELQGNLQFVAYNTDIYQHSVQLRLKYYPATLIGNPIADTQALPTGALEQVAPIPSVPPPNDGIAPASDGSCPVGYIMDPAGSGFCIPQPPQPVGSIPPNTDGTCAAGYSIDPAGSGYCILTSAVDVNGIAPALDGSCPEGYTMSPSGSGLCVPIGNLATTS